MRRPLRVERDQEQTPGTHLRRLPAQQPGSHCRSRPYPPGAAGAPRVDAIDWPELGTRKSADQYTVKTSPAAVAHAQRPVGRRVGRFKQKLPGAEIAAVSHHGTLELGRALSAQVRVAFEGFMNHVPAQRSCGERLASVFRSVLPFAQKIAMWSGHPVAFLLAVIVIACDRDRTIFNYSDTWQLVINTRHHHRAFLMVFLIQIRKTRP